jgi:hypothetical protein
MVVICYISNNNTASRLWKFRSLQLYDNSVATMLWNLNCFNPEGPWTGYDSDVTIVAEQ